MPIPRRRASAEAGAYRALADRLLRVPDPRLDGRLLGPLPSAAEIAAMADELLLVLFPGSRRLRPMHVRSVGDLREPLAAALADVAHRLEEAVFLGLHRLCREEGEGDGCRRRARAMVRRFLAA